MVDEPIPDVVMKELRPQKQEVKSHTPLCQSQVSSQVGETQVVTTILNTPITISIGKVLASSQCHTNPTQKDQTVGCGSSKSQVQLVAVTYNWIVVRTARNRL
jgi:hypothetical protein